MSDNIIIHDHRTNYVKHYVGSQNHVRSQNVKFGLTLD